MQNILITGGTGYIGSHTCVELVKNNYNIIILDNFINSNKNVINNINKITKKNIKFYNFDIRDKEKLRILFKKNNINSVIHFAGLKSVGQSCKFPLEYYNNNIYGTIILCEIMKEFNVKNLVFSSSATVYGNNISPCKETMNCDINNILNPYGKTKYIIEKILFDLYNSDKNFKIICLRYFNPIGAHESGLLGEDPLGIPNNIMPFITKVAKKELPKLTVFGNDYNTPDGTCIRDYIHTVDLAKGHIKALQKIELLDKFEVYNLGTGKGHSVLELINIFEKTNKIKINYEIGPRREGDFPICFANVEKSFAELSWKAEYNIEKMCKDVWNFKIK